MSRLSFLVPVLCGASWLAQGASAAQGFIRGDWDASGDLRINDPILHFGNLFLGERGPGCLDAADSNGDLRLDISDGIYTLLFLFAGGAPPPPPFPACGTEVEGLGCERFEACGEPCPRPIDPEILGNLVLHAYSTSVRTGQSVSFILGVWTCCVWVEPVEACVAWSVSPPGSAIVFPETGTVRVEPSVPHGTVITVTADVESGRRLLTADLHVYTPEMNPFVGTWREAAQIECGTGAEAAPEQPIEELVFEADGYFSVTWTPFEVYKDYWGRYAYDLATGAVSLEAEAGNYVPPDLLRPARGSFALRDGELRLLDLWLGTPRFDDDPPAPRCGQVFGRR
ncbi:MAG: hypothetical protein HY721_20240 [Planctomycetes bacterium]|nr:hypothetical protein [Planctomycetota bacterium]